MILKSPDLTFQGWGWQAINLCPEGVHSCQQQVTDSWWYQRGKLNAKENLQHENSFGKERVKVKSVQVEEEMPGGSI